jgi:hypothetical protein
VSSLAILAASCADELVPVRDDGRDADADMDPGTRSDAGVDADAADPGPEPPSPELDECGAWSVMFDCYLAEHRACKVDSDCAVVGDCSHADWQAIAAPFAAQANAMLRESPCPATQDGPGANAVCVTGACATVRSSLSCGAPAQDECPGGGKRTNAGCGTVASTYRDGCHVSCTLGGAASQCAPGYSCQQTTIDPCRPLTPLGPGEATCAACGAETALCLPAPGCQLQLSVKFQGNRTLETLRGAESTALELWLENLTESPLPLRFVDPCHGPVVEGLGDYDVWNACLSGVCDDDTPITELTLAPREKKLWRSAYLFAGSSSCNPTGLAPGKYTPSFRLGATGVTECGPDVAELRVSR